MSATLAALTIAPDGDDRDRPVPFPVEDREAAYQSWRATRSLKQTAETTGIAIGTLRSWSQRDSWTRRAESEDAERAELVRSHILRKVTDQVEASIDALIRIRDDAGAAPRDRRQAAVDLLGLAGLNPAKPAEPAKPSSRYTPP